MGESAGRVWQNSAEWDHRIGRLGCARSKRKTRCWEAGSVEIKVGVGLLKGCVRVCKGEFLLWNLDFCVCSVDTERDGKRRPSWCYLADRKYLLLCDSCSAIVGFHLRGKMHVFFSIIGSLIRMRSSSIQ